jgi:hypothetical protein
MDSTLFSTGFRRYVQIVYFECYHEVTVIKLCSAHCGGIGVLTVINANIQEICDTAIATRKSLDVYVFRACTQIEV